MYAKTDFSRKYRVPCWVCGSSRGLAPPKEQIKPGLKPQDQPVTKGYCHVCQKYHNKQVDNSTPTIPAPKIKSFSPTLPNRISWDYLERSLNPKFYEKNEFIGFLIHFLGLETTAQLLGNYAVGTSLQFNYSTIFWQIDLDHQIRTGKIMKYDQNGGANKNKDLFQWVHKSLYPNGFSLDQCLFGEHLLSNREKTVAVCESEKTAIVASSIFPDLIWVATGGSGGLTENKLAPLRGRPAVLFPDLDKTIDWQEKATELNKMGFLLQVSYLLEQVATDTDRSNKFDIADYIINGLK